MDEQQVRALKRHAEELRTQAGIFSRRNWGLLNEQGNVEVMPGLLDALTVRLEQAADELESLLSTPPQAAEGAWHEIERNVVVTWSDGEFSYRQCEIVERRPLAEAPASREA